jgi:hypothetical protein
MTSAPSTPTAQGDDPARVAGNIIRLHPFDGLFLRATHLDQMEQYASDLTAAIGTACGSGVVRGMNVTLDGDTLTIGPGLAIDGLGHPLLTGTEGTVSLADRKLPPDGFWLVTAERATWDYGQETVAGALCDDPCGGGSVGKPFTAEGVRFGVAAATCAGLDARGWLEKRSWLAKDQFAKEQRDAGRWTAKDTLGAGLFQQSWTPPDAADAAAKLIPLAVVIPESSGGDRQLDLWTARRDQAGPPSNGYWQWRLAMRPWPVFVAQILQFQILLAERLGLKTAGSWMSVVLDRLEQATELCTQLTKVKFQEHLKDVRTQLSRTYAGPGDAEMAASGAGGPAALRSLGLFDLPPAGFLPRYESSLDGIAGQLRQMLEMPVRVGTCAPGDVGQAVQEAQHRDRILLDQGQSQTGVDVLVPMLGSGQGPAFDWVVFVRRDDRRYPVEIAAPPTEDVGVYLVRAETGDETLRLYRDLINGKLPPDVDPQKPQPSTLASLGTLSYPVDEWAVPRDPKAESIYNQLHDLPEQVCVVGFVGQGLRRPLGAVRAQLLVADLTGFSPRLAPLSTSVGEVHGGEAIVVVAGPDDRQQEAELGGEAVAEPVAKPIVDPEPEPVANPTPAVDAEPVDVAEVEAAPAPPPAGGGRGPRRRAAKPR